jgi:hypothetical protein
VRFIMSMLRLSGVEMCFWEGDERSSMAFGVLEYWRYSIASVFFREYYVIAYHLNTSRFAITQNNVSRECGTSFGQKFIYTNLGGASSSHC